jgi:type IV pilus assembly protein PilV
MIEVLVSLVVVALGLLGYAGLLLKAQQSNQSAYARSQATMLAYDITERMRANRSAALAGSYNVAIGSSTGTGMAGTDLADWKSALAEALADGDGSVSVDLTGNVTIVVRWQDRRDGTSTSFTSQTSL